MQVEGITWHAIILEADEFAATKKLLVETFGLTPAPLRTRCDSRLRLQRRHRVRFQGGRHRRRLPPQLSSPPQDASSSAKSLASKI